VRCDDGSERDESDSLAGRSRLVRSRHEIGYRAALHYSKMAPGAAWISSAQAISNTDAGTEETCGAQGSTSPVSAELLGRWAVAGLRHRPALRPDLGAGVCGASGGGMSAPLSLAPCGAYEIDRSYEVID
jgi:hypothetical protein